MPTFTHQGLTLHYRDQGSGTPVLLLHAFPLHGELFAPQLEALTASHRLIAPDLRGFGQSQPGPGPATMTTFAEDALALLDHLGIDAAVVGGVSMGGYAALALLQLDPSRVRALVLADTQMGADDEAGRARREEVAREVERDGMGPLADSMLPRLLAQPADSALEQKVRGWILSNPPEGAAAASRGMGLRADSRNILARFAGPALIVVGEKDVITPRAKADAMANVLSHAQVVEIPGAGHLANLEQPEAFNRALDQFLRSL
ncbi:MAG: alpha/beta fold hydrolase [Myxococcaceae bacterium]|nr:alpha/beta fold hydrolase [Myxococcaceae bacterium]